MKYKLIRTDSPDNIEIDLNCGIQSFGRNNFLDCDDKRVSRCHGQIEISHSGDIDLKALHLNPCFLRKKGSSEVSILNQGEVAKISQDDQFGLLPSLYWYKVMECSDGSIHDADFPLEAVIKTEPSTNGPTAGTPTISETPDITIKKEVVDETGNINSTSTMSGTNGPTAGAPTTSETQDIVIKKEIVDETGNINSMSTISDSDKKQVVSTDMPQLKRSHSTEDREDEETTITPKLRRLSAGHSSTATTSEEEENTGMCQVKQEPASPKKEIKEESCSAHEEPVNQPQNNHVPQPPLVQVPAVLQIPVIQAMKRERCYYGSNCYRKNMVHKQQYSHPTDPDWGAEQMTPCPYGRLCRKLDQRHFRDHSHPPHIALDDDVNEQESDNEQYHDGLDFGSDGSVDIDYDF